MEWSARARSLLRLSAIAAVIGTAAVARLWALDRPAELVFDETYYVKDAYTLLHLGYEGSWPEGSDGRWAEGEPGGFSADPAFVAHPPLGKWIIALGMAVLGAESPWGWRISIALLGILLVGLTMLAAQLLFRARPLSLMAGGLMAIDGVAIVLSRVSLLDTALAVLVLLGFCFVVLDRHQVRRRLAGRSAGGGRATGIREWGPVLWWRPWLLAAALALGLGSAVKWSALYYLAALGIATVVSDVFLFRRAGHGSWARVVLRQGPVDFLLLVPLALAAHLASWTGWFATEGGYHRNWIGTGGEPWGGLLAWVPHAVQNWWHYQTQIFGFHTGLVTEHGYQAHPAGWLLLLRPTSMWYRDYGDGTAGEIISLGNPLIWWAGTAALVALLVRVILRLLRRQPAAAEALVLVGVAAGWLPWFQYPQRPVFQFYSIVFLPYLAIALAFWLHLLLAAPDDPPGARRIGIASVVVFLVACAGLSVFFWPLWSGAAVPLDYLRMHYWFRSWI